MKGKEHEEVVHVDDRLMNKTVVVERTKGSPPKTEEKEGGCCGGGCGSKH